MHILIKLIFGRANPAASAEDEPDSASGGAPMASIEDEEWPSATLEYHEEWLASGAPESIHFQDIAGLDDEDEADSGADDFCVNPANGLPMMGGMLGLDIEGNPYGFDHSTDIHDDDGLASDVYSGGSLTSDDSWSISVMGDWSDDMF